MCILKKNCLLCVSWVGEIEIAHGDVLGVVAIKIEKDHRGECHRKHNLSPETPLPFQTAQ